MRRLLRLDTYLLVVILILAAILGFLVLQRQSFEEELSSLEGQILRTRNLIQDFRQEKAGLEQSWREFQALPPLLTLPGKDEALKLGSQLAIRAYNLGITITEFQSSYTTLPQGNGELPALSYALVVQGDTASLLEMLNLTNELPTTKIQELTLVRMEESWVLALSFLVAYQ